jgi:mutator protein MutT
MGVVLENRFGEVMERRECVCFLLIENDQILLEKRFNDACCESYLNIPGGHIEAGETQVETLLREVEEELGVTPLAYTFLCSEQFDKFAPQLLHYFVVTKWSGRVLNNELQQLVWSPLKNVSLANKPDRVAVKCYLDSLVEDSSSN